MSSIAFRGAVELGLIYSLVALGLYLSYRILDIADLTVDGSFTLGAAVSAVFTVAGRPFLGLFLSLLAGALAGFVTAFLQTKLGVQPILAGIITMTALYSINLQVMGDKSNVTLLRKETAFTLAEGVFTKDWAKLGVAFLAAAAVSLALILFLRTNLGLSVRATGDNRDMVRSSSINTDFTITVGLCAANAMVALSGALLAQYQMFSEITVGTGMVIVGLASLIIGEVITGTKSVPRCVLGAAAGAIIYRLIMAFALDASVSPQNLKLVSAVVVAAAISWPAVRDQIAFAAIKRRRKAEKSDADLK